MYSTLMKSTMTLARKNIIRTPILAKNMSNINLRKEKVTSRDQLMLNNGLKNFLKDTYMWTSAGICGSIGISLLGSMNPDILSINSLGLMVGLGFGMSIAGIIGINRIKCVVHSKHEKNSKNGEILYSTNPTARIISYGCLASGMGLTMIPMAITFPSAIFPAFVASSSVFGGASLFAFSKQQGEFEPYKNVLYGGLTGFAAISLTGLFSHLLFGINMYGDIAHIVTLYGGLPLFTGLIAYDTHVAIESYHKGDPDHLGCSVDLFLDFLNVFVRFVEIIGKLKQNDN
jgi:FtsH-binding integral membrane protein